MNNADLIQEVYFLDEQIKENESEIRLLFDDRMRLLEAQDFKHLFWRKKKRDGLREEIKILLNDNGLATSKLNKKNEDFIALRDKLEKEILKNIKTKSSHSLRKAND
jgi:hypothetical protein